jgi:hypothetical protein
MGITIKDAPLVEQLSGGEKIPVSDGSGLPKAITAEQIKDYIAENITVDNGIYLLELVSFNADKFIELKKAVENKKLIQIENPPFGVDAYDKIGQVVNVTSSSVILRFSVYGIVPQIGEKKNYSQGYVDLECKSNGTFTTSDDSFKIERTGNGKKFLSDDGTYKEVTSSGYDDTEIKNQIKANTDAIAENKADADAKLSELDSKIEGKQNVLKSGENIKTINGQSIIGGGNIVIEGGTSTDTVTGVKGDSETSYRKGEVNITASNIGLGNVDNTADSEKSVKYAMTSGTSEKSISDASGNVITETYATKSELSQINIEIAQAKNDASIAKNAVATLEGLANANEAMQTLAGQVVQIEENKQNVSEIEKDLYGGYVEETILDITESNFQELEYSSINAPAGRRGLILFDISNEGAISKFNTTVSVKSDSTIKVAVHRSSSGTVWGTYSGDTGWITSGTSKTIDNTFGESTDKYLRFITTYNSGVGIPTLEEIKQYVTFSLYSSGEVYKEGALEKVENNTESVEAINEKINGSLSTVEGIVLGGEYQVSESVNVSSLEVRPCSLGSSKMWFQEESAGRHVAIPVSNGTNITISASIKTFVGFVTDAYVTNPNSGSNVPYCSETPDRITIAANSETKLDIPNTASFCILTVIDGAGNDILYNSVILDSVVVYEPINDRIDKIQKQADNNEKSVTDLGEKLAPQKVFNLSLQDGYAINSNGVQASADYKLIDYVDVSDVNKVVVKGGFWNSLTRSYSTIIELYNADKAVINRIVPSDLIGITNTAYAYVFDGEIDVSEASFIRFCNLRYIPSSNTNADFSIVEASVKTKSLEFTSERVLDENIKMYQSEFNEKLNKTIFGDKTETVEETLTEENITSEGYQSVTNAGGRGFFNIPISGYDNYSLNLSVVANSTVKAAITLLNVASYADNPIYDSKWIVAGGTSSVNKNTSTNTNIKYIQLRFTYISSGAGVPTIEEIKQYISIDFKGAAYADLGLIGKVSDLEKVVLPESTSGYTYQGEKVSFKDNAFTSEVIGSLSSGVSSRQGGAVFGDYLFQFHNTLETIVAYNLKTKNNVQTLTLPPISNHHAGSGGFGNEYYDSTDPFPILYISSMYENRVYGYRITGTEGSWAIETVQTITINKEGLYIPNIAIDRENNMVVVFGYTKNSWSDSNNNLSVITSFVLPKLSDGDVTIEEFSDVRKIPFIYAEQGAFARLGKLYLSYGNTISKCGMYVIDYISGIAVSHAPFEPLGNFEPEAFGLYEGNIIMTNQNGNIYKLTF